MKITVPADAKNTQNILTLIEEMGYKLPCNCQGKHLCSGKNYSFDCAMIPKESVTVTLPESGQAVRGIALENRPVLPGGADTLLIDLGTTTVALVLLDRKTGVLRQTHVFPNPQRILGADVISRIQASCAGQAKRLSELIRTALREETSLLCRKNRQSVDEINSCLIGGNTTMIHLLMEYDCTPLASSPFVPGVKPPDSFRYGSATIHILPWMSAFVGGDITAGIIACGLETTDRTTLLIDLGTNGEMVLSHNRHLYTAATAAGPALEGASLSCGCAAVPGAISQVRLHRNRAAITTIDNKLPIGLCGSGAFSLCAELLRNALLQTDGILSDNFPAEGISLGTTPQGRKLTFTAEDLRELQLAIAAIGAGIDTLCFEAGISPDTIEMLYVGGGFGLFLDISDCILLHMLPDIPTDRIQARGNTCLQGLYELSINEGHHRHAVSLPYSTVNLADNDCFKERFIRHMTYSDDVISTTYS